MVRAAGKRGRSSRRGGRRGGGSGGGVAVRGGPGSIRREKRNASRATRNKTPTRTSMNQSRRVSNGERAVGGAQSLNFVGAGGGGGGARTTAGAKLDVDSRISGHVDFPLYCQRKISGREKDQQQKTGPLLRCEHDEQMNNQLITAGRWRVEGRKKNSNIISSAAS